jgi:fatty-acyl-CoA synthase
VARELTYILNDCQPKVLITGPEFMDVLADMRSDLTVTHHVALEGAEIEDAQVSELGLEHASAGEPERPVLHEDDTYAILYTSGTTGRPKGAMIPHRQIVWNCINTLVSWGLREDDVSPVFTPLFHAGGLFAFLTPILYAGGRIVLSRTFDLDESLRAVVEERCTVILGVPTIFQMWMNTPTYQQANFDHVRFFISGGAPLPVPLVAAWLEQKGGVFRQGYGLTEVGANCFSMTDEESVTKMGSVGKPIFHSRMRLVDEQDQAVPRGDTGELLIAGPHVCTGYWRNPEASAKAIRDGWFHTGDMARQDADGFFYIVGRLKDMIISGGENVYAAEVEAVFREHPAVADAALIGQPDEKWGEVGLMIVVPEAGATPTEEELVAFCREHLARFKVPKRVLFTHALPYSPYGKVMKEELKKEFLD